MLSPRAKMHCYLFILYLLINLFLFYFLGCKELMFYLFIYLFVLLLLIIFWGIMKSGKRAARSYFHPLFTFFELECECPGSVLFVSIYLFE